MPVQTPCWSNANLEFWLLLLHAIGLPWIFYYKNAVLNSLFPCLIHFQLRIYTNSNSCVSTGFTLWPTARSVTISLRAQAYIDCFECIARDHAEVSGQLLSCSEGSLPPVTHKQWNHFCCFKLELALWQKIKDKGIKGVQTAVQVRFCACA